MPKPLAFAPPCHIWPRHSLAPRPADPAWSGQWLLFKAGLNKKMWSFNNQNDTVNMWTSKTYHKHKSEIWYDLMTLCLKPICSMVLVHQHLPQQIHPNADKYTIRHTWSIWVTSLPSKTWELTNCTKNDTIVRTHWVVTGMLQGDWSPFYRDTQYNGAKPTIR